MSVRAYKIEKIAKSPTFNCWNEDLIMSVADQTNYIDGGYITIEKDEIERLKSRLSKEKDKMSNVLSKKNQDKLEDLNYTLELIEQILKDIGKEDSVDYICY